MSNRMKAGFIYLLTVHVLLALILWKSDFINKIEVKLGLERPTMDFYQKMTVVHRIMDDSIPDNSVLFIGDSITQALNTSAVSDLSVNFGIYSDTTQGVAERISDYKSLERANAVVLAIGVNDIHQRVNRVDTLNSYRDILEHIPTGTFVVATSILPIGINAEMPGFTNDDIVSLNQDMEKISKDYECVDFFDIHTNFLSSTGHLQPELHIGDGVHLSAQGYNLLIEKLREVVSQAQCSN